MIKRLGPTCDSAFMGRQVPPGGDAAGRPYGPGLRTGRWAAAHQQVLSGALLVGWADEPDRRHGNPGDGGAGGAHHDGCDLVQYPADDVRPVNDRMRAMDHERLDILTGTAGTLLSAAEVPPAGRERLTQIDAQLPMLLRRHRLLHNAVLVIYAGVAVLVLSVIAIGIAVTGRSGAAGTAALALVLAGTVMLLGGLLFAARSIMISMNAIDYEVRRALSLGS
jgi:hypothetical protein